MKNFTLASAKSFIKKNRANLKIKVKSSFDGMCDSVVSKENSQFVAVKAADNVFDNNLGIAGVWFTRTGNSFYPLYDSTEKVIGFECYNCCGAFVLKV